MQKSILFKLYLEAKLHYLYTSEKEPKYIIMRIAAVLFLLLGLIAIWYGESRKFFCLKDGQCVTVWKTYGNTCYIVPGRYYGLIGPFKNFIKSTNTNAITFFLTEKMPNTWIFKSEQRLDTVSSETTSMLDYSSNAKKFDEILYKPNAERHNDVKNDVTIIEIDIRENYAIDKTGKKL